MMSTRARRIHTVSQLLCVTVLLLWAIEPGVDAYLDPGTGYSAVQVVLGGIAAAFVAIRLFWTRIVSAVTGIFRRPATKSSSQN